MYFIFSDAVDETSAEYANWQKEQDEIERFEIEQIERSNEKEQQKWLHAEMIAMEQWQRLQEKNELLRQQRLEQEAKLKMVTVELVVVVSSVFPKVSY